MTSRSYFDKMNSTLGSVVPLAMFIFIFCRILNEKNYDRFLDAQLRKNNYVKIHIEKSSALKMMIATYTNRENVKKL